MTKKHIATILVSAFVFNAALAEESRIGSHITSSDFPEVQLFDAEGFRKGVLAEEKVIGEEILAESKDGLVQISVDGNKVWIDATEVDTDKPQQQPCLVVDSTDPDSKVITGVVGGQEECKKDSNGKGDDN